MAREFSPEEKLLNLIKRKKGQGGTQARPQAPAIKTEEPLGGMDKIIPAPSFDLGRMVNLENINILNASLFVMLILILLYFLIDIFLIPPKEGAILNEKVAERPPRTKEIEVKPYSYYSKAITAKEVFKPLAREETREVKREVPIEDLMGNLALLGIVSGESPQAIIEDKKQKKSFFLREGQTASGIFLKHIGEDTVTVVYKGEEFNLTL